MKIYRIDASYKKKNSWAHFEVDQSIGPKEILQYKNIDDAKESPLVQQLFYLPFVKSVNLSDKTISVERFDILEWEDVIIEVKEQLETYLNDGGIVIEAKKNDKIPVSVYAESTPNPGVMKFVANKPLVSQSVEFKNIDEAKISPLAQKLFNFAYVKEVFIDVNYVSITKYEVTEWDSVVMEIREFIRAFIEQGNLILTEVPTPINTNSDKESIENLNPTEEQIVSILEEYIKPAVASDGGNIKFESYDESNKSVHVILQGACSGCPSSTFTLKNGIENMLKEMMQGKINTVVAVNG